MTAVVFLASIALGAAYWVLEAAVDALASGAGGFIHHLVSPDPEDVWTRLVGVLLASTLAGTAVANRLGALRHDLRENEDRYRRIIALARGVAYERDWISKQFSFIDEGIEWLTGYTAEEMTPELFDGLVEDQAFLTPKGQRSPEADLPLPPNATAMYLAEYRLRTRQGDTVWVTDSAVQVRDADGRMRTTLGMLQDITERKRAEQALRESEATLASILRATPAGIGLTRDRTLQWANAFLCSMLGYTKEELVGQSTRKLYATNEEFERVGVAKYTEMRRRGTGTVETRWARKDGKVLDILLSSSPLDAADHSAGVTFTALDITERAHTQNAQRMAAIGQLAAGVAHEFNNLLAIMSGRAELAAELQTPDSFDKLVDAVLQSTVRGADVCKNLMSFARPQEPKREAIAVRQFIEGALAMAEQEFRNADIDVVRDCRAEGLYVLADAGQMEQVMLNLVINAIHAMPGGGTLTVKAALVGAQASHSEVAVQVSDTGHGIPPEYLQRVFDPFFTTKGRLGESEVPGSGLGLSVSHGIVRAHGGSLSVRSRPGEGATFDLRLSACAGPAEPVEVASAVPAHAKAAMPCGAHILVAEDEDDLREVVASTLQDSGHEVSAVSTSARAIEILGHGGVDLLLCDLMMPGGGAREVLAAIGHMPRRPTTIIMTGRAEERLADELVAKGAVACIRKPFRLQQMLELVTAHLPQDQRARDSS